MGVTDEGDRVEGLRISIAARTELLSHPERHPGVTWYPGKAAKIREELDRDEAELQSLVNPQPQKGSGDDIRR